MNPTLVRDLAVLVISNRAVAREQIVGWLRSPRIHLAHATTAAAAVSRAHEHEFDLIVFDCGLDPLGMEGVETVVSREFLSTPKLVLCAPDDLAKVPTATRQVVYLLAADPLNEEAFLDAVRQALPAVDELLPRS